MQAAELAAEFGSAGIPDFVETEHGLVKAAISLDGVAGELYLQGAHLTAWQPPGERPVLHQPQQRFCAWQGDPRRHPDHIPVVRRQPARAGSAAARLCAYRTMASRQRRNRRPRVADPDLQSRRRRCRLAVLAGAVSHDLHVVFAHAANPPITVIIGGRALLMLIAARFSGSLQKKISRQLAPAVKG